VLVLFPNYFYEKSELLNVQEAMLLSVLNSKYPINTFAFQNQQSTKYEPLVDKIPFGSAIRE